METRGSDGLYCEEGWVNIPWVAAHRCWLNVIIGSRQVGKTFGTLKYLLENNLSHIYMRRTLDEMDVITEDPDLNPYLPLSKVGFHTELIRQGKGWGVYDYREDTDEDGMVVHTPTVKRGVGLPLPRVAKLRGFSGDRFTDLVFDEFIPEKMVVQRQGEGDAFKNALITIAGNRHLEGRDPLRVWLLANANDLFSPIMVGMNLTRHVADMVKKEEELRVLPDGVLIAMVDAALVQERRQESAMIRFLNDGSEFADMAFGNKFAYNNTQQVRLMPMRGMQPYIRVWDFYIWKARDWLYCTTCKHHVKEHYKNTEDDKNLCAMRHPELVPLYTIGEVFFSDAVVLYQFRQYFGIKQ